MNNYSIFWEEYLRSGNRRLAKDSDVLCTGETWVKADDAVGATLRFSKTFKRAKIISVKPSCPN